MQLRVITADKPGVLARLSTELSATGVNLKEANCRVGDDGRAVNLFSFTVTDLSRLKAVMRGLQKLEGVYEVERV